MAKFELTIDASYLPNWGVYEGVRELVQNSRDAEIQNDAPMTVSFAKRRVNGEEVGAVVINNDGTILPKEALLIGRTTKLDDSRTIGQFGEGLKFGILALLRQGLDIKIRNGSEVWIPSIERSERYNADVLVIHTTKNNKDVNRVQFELMGISKSEWNKIQSRLLFLRKEHLESIDVHGGRIITDHNFIGQVFVKGMFVAKTDCKFGYDFDHADIDRDRRMISNMSDKTSDLLAKAVNKGFISDGVYKLLMEGAEEASMVSHYRLDSAGKEAIANKFREDNPEAIAVEYAHEVDELDRFGKRGIQVGWNMRGIIEQELGTAASHLKSLRKSVSKQYSFGDLDDKEAFNIRSACNLIARAQEKLGETPLVTSKVLAVDFNDDKLLGTYNTESGEINIAKKILGNRGQTIYTLVHEVAHAHADDGMIGHERAIGSIMAEVLNLVQI